MEKRTKKVNYSKKKTETRTRFKLYDGIKSRPHKSIR